LKILLTGGSGLVGSTLVPLLRKKHKIVHFDFRAPNDGLPWIQGDLRDSNAIDKACRSVDAIIHIAALHGKAWKETGDDVGFDVNVTGTKNVLEAAVKNGLKRFVFTSSIRATGHFSFTAKYYPIDETKQCEPINLYGLTKKLGEQMCSYYSNKYRLSTICLRPGVILTDVDTDRRWKLLFNGVDIRDVAKAHLLALESDKNIKHEVFNITADSKLSKISFDKFKSNPFAVLENLYPGINKLLSENQKIIFSKQEWYTIEKARSILGYNPEHNFRINGRQS